ncbi:hypothetical protein LMG28688_04701 [Paraburkholderia caffeinitolerans]|uniref:Auto-transporter adhesin head GIN domain-containing protein n=1 Tax=Paraburkholderia caffeinitolerans TaxID=1723730 RepID=A0A6J5GDX8_9BURK|nr:hypothetical protein [Paraburkholderia caffeinitolerans]CAB3798325.1 hypothetical protein LMG28688_04701 [Paraburkholderia caffeinitolerans]
MIASKVLIAGLAFASIGVQVAHAQSTTALLCQGSGTVLDSQVSNGMVYDEKTHSYTKSTSSSTTSHRPFSGAVNVEIAGGSVRMKLPHDLVPKLNSAQEGWFALENAFVGDREITGILHLNALNKPKVRIDRMTGQLTLASGFEDFSGSCAKVDSTSGPKF